MTKSRARTAMESQILGPTAYRGRQPFSVRILIWSNVLLTGLSLPLPGSSIGLHVIFTFVAGCLAWRETGRKPKRIVSVTVSCVAAYGAIAFLVGPCVDYAPRVAVSILLLIMLTWAMSRCAAVIDPSKPLLPTADATNLLLLIAVSVALEFAYKFLTTGEWSSLRVGGIYLEPSHLACSASALIFFVLRQGNIAEKRKVTGATIVLLVMASSATLLLLIAILFVCELITNRASTGWRRLAGLTVGALAFLIICEAFPFVYPSMYLEVVDRVSGILDLNANSNLSSLVFVHGWLLSESYFLSSGGLGLGFNAMGCTPLADTDVSQWLSVIGMDGMNYNDGSFIVSKIVSELGVLGLGLWLGSVWLSLVIARGRCEGQRIDSKKIAYAWVATMSIGGALRSTSLFSGPALLAVFALLAMFGYSRTAVGITSRRSFKNSADDVLHYHKLSLPDGSDIDVDMEQRL